MRAVILAAGRGSRLEGAGAGVVKPLMPVGGVPLIDRVLCTLASAGVREAAIVLGYQGETIQRHLEGLSSPIVLHFVENPEWRLANGVSVLAAGAFVRGPTLLSMADHLYDAAIPQALLAEPPGPGEAALAVDRNISGVFDLDDATKVRTEGDRIVDIGKEIPVFDALDTGVFSITEGLVDALTTARAERGDCSLSDGVRRLAAAGRMWAREAPGARWLDVDTPESLRHAERTFAAAVPSKTST